MSAPELGHLQGWLQDAIVRPSLPRGVRGPIEPAARHVKPSETLRAAARVAIYAEMHVLRLREAVASDYPALRAIAGEPAFTRLVDRYLAAHPSRHWSLNVLGRALPAWLAGDVRVPRRALLCDVARVECAMSVVFDAPRGPVLSPADAAALPPDTWTDPCPRLVGALELLRLDHPANALVTAARSGDPLPAARRARAHVVVWRREHRVWRRDLEPAMYAVLESLRGGASLARSLESAASVHAGSAEELQALVGRSFATWIEEGFFAAIERGES